MTQKEKSLRIDIVTGVPVNSHKMFLTSMVGGTFRSLMLLNKNNNEMRQSDLNLFQLEVKMTKQNKNGYLVATLFFWCTTSAVDETFLIVCLP